jgi:hypothetical protein
LKIQRTKARKTRSLGKRSAKSTCSNDELDGKCVDCGIIDANTCITERTSGPKQQRDAQSELDDPKFRQQLVCDLKVLFNGNFEEESTQQLQDILDHVRSNQTIAMASADEHTQVSHLLTIVTKLTSVF